MPDGTNGNVQTDHDGHGDMDELLSVSDVARRYGVSSETVRRWIRKGIIAYVMVGPFRLKRIQRVEADRHFTPVKGV